MKKLLVMGNAAIDGLLSKDVSIEVKTNSVVLRYGRKVIQIPVEKGPIKAGGKYTATISFYEELQHFPRTEQFGGGGYLSGTSLRRFSDAEIYYLDISTPSLDTSVPGNSLADRLVSFEINPYFLSARPIPFNVVLGERTDKIIVKSQLGKKTFGNYHRFLINEIINDSSGILINSLKDEELAELAVAGSRNGKTLFSIITDSLDPDFVLKTILPYSICQFNYDEFGFIVNPDHKVVGDEETRIESAFEGIKRIRADYKTKNNIYVTLGRNGVLCANSSRVYHIRFRDDVLERIQPTVNKNPKSTTGAGDAHGASVFHDELLGLRIEQIGQRASVKAVRYLGYEGSLTSEDFVQSSCNAYLS